MGVQIYLCNVWENLSSIFSPVAEKGRGNIVHKDFAKCISQFVVYMSADHNCLLTHLYGHQADCVEYCLCSKFHRYILHKFMSHLEESTRPEPMQSTDVSPFTPEASQGAMRYIPGMCFAKRRFKQGTYASNNIHDSSKQHVNESRIKIQLLDCPILSQQQAQQQSLEPGTLQLTISKQNARLSLNHVSNDAFKLFQLVDQRVKRIWVVQNCFPSKAIYLWRPPKALGIICCQRGMEISFLADWI